MNIICGILRFDEQPVCEQQLAQCHFQSPIWTPDHQAMYLEQKIGFTCTQRFMAVENSKTLMPYQDSTSQCVVVADLWFTNRPSLLSLLSLNKDCSDVELLLAAYLKWGVDCTRYLQGPFMFAIWDAPQQKLFIATDHLGIHPCLYAYVPGKYFIFANHMAPFRQLCAKLTLNPSLFERFALDYFTEGQTCYHEVRKMLFAHQIIVNKGQFKEEPYWHLQKKSSPSYKTRDEYYQEFRELFVSKMQQYLRSDYPVTAQISGGLDSSSIACIAAQLLAKNNQPLYTFTAVPQGLDGPSYRKGWYYHEMPRVDTALQQYPNMIHTAYQSSPLSDPLAELSKFYPYVDQPFRNVFNLDWILACMEQAQSRGSRHILWGQRGNATISWAGHGLLQVLAGLYRNMRLLINKTSLFDGFFKNLNTELLRRKDIKQTLLRRGWSGDSRAIQFGFSAAIQTSVRPISYWYGVEALDPSGDIELLQYCYNLPEWVYLTGRAPTKRRLLIREGLADLVPEAIRFNPYRGEQAADGYLQYNQHIVKWWEKTLQTTKQDNHLLWQIYDKQKILNIFEQYKQIAVPSAGSRMYAEGSLVRCLSSGFFMDFLNQ